MGRCIIVFPANQSIGLVGRPGGNTGLNQAVPLYILRALSGIIDTAYNTAHLWGNTYGSSLSSLMIYILSSSLEVAIDAKSEWRTTSDRRMRFGSLLGNSRAFRRLMSTVAIA